MAVGLKRMQALIACGDGNDLACELAGPGLVGHESSETVGGDTSDDLVIEDAEFTLRFTTRTSATGETERVLYYQDVDGTFLSGRTTEPIEVIPHDRAPAEDAPESAEEGLTSFLEGALLSDIIGNDTWSAKAGQTAIGFISVAGQIADARDTLADLRDVAESKDGREGFANGWNPGIGGVPKGGTSVAIRPSRPIPK